MSEDFAPAYTIAVPKLSGSSEGAVPRLWMRFSKISWPVAKSNVLNVAPSGPDREATTLSQVDRMSCRGIDER